MSGGTKPKFLLLINLPLASAAGFNDAANDTPFSAPLSFDRADAMEDADVDAAAPPTATEAEAAVVTLLLVVDEWLEGEESDENAG